MYTCELYMCHFVIWFRIHCFTMYMYVMYIDLHVLYCYRAFWLSAGLNSFHTTFLSPPSLHTGTCAVVSTELLLQRIHRTDGHQIH